MTDVIQIPTLHNRLDKSLFVCSDDWMLECDECGARYGALEWLRGTGDEGLEIGRQIAREDGWQNDTARDYDLCPACVAAVAVDGTKEDKSND